VRPVPRPGCDFVETTVFVELKTDWRVFSVEEFVFVIIFTIRVIVEKSGRAGLMTKKRRI
jgi:hypothetical protein